MQAGNRLRPGRRPNIADLSPEADRTLRPASPVRAVRADAAARVPPVLRLVTRSGLSTRLSRRGTMIVAHVAEGVRSLPFEDGEQVYRATLATGDGPPFATTIHV